MPITIEGNYNHDNADKGDVFIQYKGTELCADIVCPNCQEQEHIDGYFAYVWQCPDCKKIYQLGCYVNLKEIK